jgi:hypothetical protein
MHKRTLTNSLQPRGHTRGRSVTTINSNGKRGYLEVTAVMRPGCVQRTGEIRASAVLYTQALRARASESASQARIYLVKIKSEVSTVIWIDFQQSNRYPVCDRATVNGGFEIPDNLLCCSDPPKTERRLCL